MHHGMSGWSKTVFEVRARFAAPLDFVYTWLTDFSPDDPAITGDTYQRKLIAKSAQRVVFEDLSETGGGWSWLRNTVALSPPSRWRMVAMGNALDARATYRLVSRANNSTELIMRWRLRSGITHGKVPKKTSIEAGMRNVWAVYGKALERDYARARHRTGAVEPTVGNRRRNLLGHTFAQMRRPLWTVGEYWDLEIESEIEVISETRRQGHPAGPDHSCGALPRISVPWRTRSRRRNEVDGTESSPLLRVPTDRRPE